MKLPPANVVPVGEAIGPVLPISGTDNWPVGGLTSWDAKGAVGATSFRDYRPADMATLIALPDRDIKLLVSRNLVKRASIQARVLWDGVHGEPQTVRLSNRVMRRVRHFRRHRHLCRQFFPKKFKRTRNGQGHFETYDELAQFYPKR